MSQIKKIMTNKKLSKLAQLIFLVAAKMQTAMGKS